NPQRARLHLFANEFAHLIELFRRRLFIFETDHVFANRGRADERCDVAGNAAALQITQIFRERIPFDVVFDVALLTQHTFADAIVHRTHRFAFAHDLGSDPLPDLALRTTVLN